MSMIDMIQSVQLPVDSNELNSLPKDQNSGFSELLEASSRKDTGQTTEEQKTSGQTANMQKTDDTADSDKMAAKPETGGGKDVETAEHNEKTGERDHTVSAKPPDPVLEQAMVSWLESQVHNAVRVNSNVPAGDEAAAVVSAEATVASTEAKAATALAEAEVVPGKAETVVEVVSGKAEVEVELGKAETAVVSGKAETAVEPGKAEAEVVSGKAETAVELGKAEAAAVEPGKAEAAVMSGKTEVAVEPGKAEAAVMSGKAETAVSLGKADAVASSSKVDAAVLSSGKAEAAATITAAGAKEAALDVPGANGLKAEVSGLMAESAGKVTVADNSQFAGELVSEQEDSAVSQLLSEVKPTDAAKVSKQEGLRDTQTPDAAATVKAMEDEPQTSAEEKHESEPQPSAEGEHESVLLKASAKSDNSQPVRQKLSNETVHANGNQIHHPVTHNRLEAGSQPTTATVKTTPDTLPEDVGRAIAARLPVSNGTMTIELEPVSLGKLTIQVVYEEGRAAVSILSSNSKTLELLSQKAGEIAQILENKTGQQTVIYTPEAPQQEQMDDSPNGGQEQREQHQEQKEQRHDRQELDSFAQQLRLGLV